MKEKEDKPAPPEPQEKPRLKPQEAAREKAEGTWAHLVRVRQRANA